MKFLVGALFATTMFASKCTVNNTSAVAPAQNIQVAQK